MLKALSWILELDAIGCAIARERLETGRHCEKRRIARRDMVTCRKGANESGSKALLEGKRL